MLKLRLVLFTTLSLAAVPAAFAQAAAPGRVVDEADRVVLAGNVPRRAQAAVEIGRTNAQLALQHMVLYLLPRAGARDEIVQLLAAQQDPASQRYHQWLTPEQFGARFGAADADLQVVQQWLGSHGLTVDGVAQGRGWLNFSGTVGQVEQAFATEMHDYQVAGTVRHANAMEPSIPKALSDVVGGVVSLNSFPQPAHLAAVKALGKTVPAYDSKSGSHYLAPADFATIYDVATPYDSGVTGAGQTIAIVARSDINLSDVQQFRSAFGLPANDPVFVHNGPAPGLVSGDESESDLDTEWSGAVAPKATIKLVISPSTEVSDGVLLSTQYIVDQNLAPVFSTSYGLCEADTGASEIAFYDSLLAQAAAQGMTAVSSAGDSGAADCSDPGGERGQGRAVDMPCASPNNTCAGGSQFLDTTSPGAYWASSNNSTTGSSALGYIPEMAWNESGAVAGGSGLWATGGGVSTAFTKPAWQSAPGVPADGQRDVPDVVLSAAAHDGYLAYQDGSLVAFSGTSCAAPTFAGLMALVLQQTAGARQGNVNPTLYKLAAAQYGSGGVAVFHDAKSGNNSVPGVTGYTAGTAYDTVTGLGSVDAAQLLAQWPGSSSSGGGGTGGSGTPAPSTCTAGANTLCLIGNRFSVTAAYNAGASGAGAAQTVSLTDDTGYLWFFDSSNIEAVVKVLNGCGVDGHYWVFAGGLTNVNVTITVTDTQTGAFHTYSSAANTPFQSIQDTAAFSTCP